MNNKKFLIDNENLMKEWNYEKNLISPETITYGSNKKVWWKCEFGHSWIASINHRNNGTRCPHCFLEYGTSFPEQSIYYYLSKITQVENRVKLFGQEIDIYLPRYKIGFEYDGSFYHDSESSRKKEAKKNKIIEENGIILYRIKESNKFNFDKKNKIIYCVVDRDYKYIEKVLEIIEKILDIKFNDIDIINDSSNIYNQYVKTIKKRNLTVTNPELLQ